VCVCHRWTSLLSILPNCCDSKTVIMTDLSGMSHFVSVITSFMMISFAYRGSYTMATLYYMVVIL